jgi:hypothetical protein
MSMLDEIIALCNKEGDGDVLYYKEGFVADDYASGNIDDAWGCGFDDGRRSAFQEILGLIEQNS